MFVVLIMMVWTKSTIRTLPKNTVEHLDNVLFWTEEIFSPFQMGMPEAIASAQYFERNPLRVAYIPSFKRKKYAFDAINIILDLLQEVSG